MPSPFPGMDPYLEDHGVFPDLHQSLASAVRDALNGLLPARYYAKLESRPEIGITDDTHTTRPVVPDVAVLHAPPVRPKRPGDAVAVLEEVKEVAGDEEPGVRPARSYEVSIRGDAVPHVLVEVRDSVSDHRLVTLVEIVSPSNKRAGPDREAYVRKQQDVLRTDANTVEIDLLRAGRHPFARAALADFVAQVEPPRDYLVLVSRYWRRLTGVVGYQIYPVGVREPLPQFYVPLREHEEEVLLDLQSIFDRVYDNGPYRRGAVDYTTAPTPPLGESDAAWADGLLRRAGLRGAA